MNKKAFTLIELLAVVIILGILGGLAVGAYYKYLDKARNESFKMAEKTLVNDVKDAYADCLSNFGNEFCDNHSNFGYINETIYLNELIQTGYSNKIKDPYDTNSYCDPNLSYVKVIVNTASTQINKDINYQVCLVCGDKISSTCE